MGIKCTLRRCQLEEFRSAEAPSEGRAHTVSPSIGAVPAHTMTVLLNGCDGLAGSEELSEKLKSIQQPEHLMLAKQVLPAVTRDQKSPVKGTDLLP